VPDEPWFYRVIPTPQELEEYPSGPDFDWDFQREAPNEVKIRVLRVAGTRIPADPAKVKLAQELADLLESCRRGRRCGLMICDHCGQRANRALTLLALRALRDYPVLRQVTVVVPPSKGNASWLINGTPPNLRDEKQHVRMWLRRYDLGDLPAFGCVEIDHKKRDNRTELHVHFVAPIEGEAELYNLREHYREACKADASLIVRPSDSLVDWSDPVVNRPKAISYFLKFTPTWKLSWKGRPRNGGRAWWTRKTNLRAELARSALIWQASQSLTDLLFLQRFRLSAVGKLIRIGEPLLSSANPEEPIDRVKPRRRGKEGAM
jgi:hypothetical protein